MARQSGRLEALYSIWPDLQMLKQLWQEVQEAKVKMNRTEKVHGGAGFGAEEGGRGGAGGGISPEVGGAAGGEAR